jgi:S1-C subfamily serine protease
MITSNSATKASASVITLIFVAGLLVGGLLIFYVNYRTVTDLRNEVADLQTNVSVLRGTQNLTYQSITVLQNGTSLIELYANLKESIVLIQGETTDGTVQGSGFAYTYNNQNVILTNYHVVEDTTSLSVTFADGQGYSATVLGTDPYADLAVVSVSGNHTFKPLTIVSSSTVQVGEPVIAIGNPYGLVGSLTTGIVSATGRSITEDTAGGYSIANVIQTSTPINPGNSGGPLLNSLGNVIGITTAIVSESQGLGFAIPSNAILKEISTLIKGQPYNGHSLLGVTGNDMSYSIAQQTGSDYTYGWKIASINRGGPSDGKLTVNDIIIGMNNQTIRNNDDLASFLEEYTLPGDNINITVVRDNQVISNITVTLGTRPAPST